ncbi:MAG: ABC transporter, substrate-binding protein (cluster 5, nickel/peptides/opines), partial [uncultured Thermomicrobiales bacterium]
GYPVPGEGARPSPLRRAARPGAPRADRPSPGAGPGGRARHVGRVARHPLGRGRRAAGSGWADGPAGAPGCDAEAGRHPEGRAPGRPVGPRPPPPDADRDLARHRARLQPAAHDQPRPHRRPRAGRGDAGDLRRRPDLHLHAAPGRHVPPAGQPAAGGERRRRLLRAVAGAGVGGGQRPRLGRYHHRPGRRDGRDHPQAAGRLDPADPGHLQRDHLRPGDDRGERRPLPGRGRDRAVPLRRVRPQHPGRPREEPRVLGGGAALPRRPRDDLRLGGHPADERDHYRRGRLRRVRAAARHRPDGGRRRDRPGRRREHEHPVHRLQPHQAAAGQPPRPPGDRGRDRPEHDPRAGDLRPRHPDGGALPADLLGGAERGDPGPGRRARQAADGRGRLRRRSQDVDHVLVPVLVPVGAGAGGPGAAQADRDRRRAEPGRDRDDDRGRPQRRPGAADLRDRGHRHQRPHRPGRGGEQLQDRRERQPGVLQQPAGRRADRPGDGGDRRRRADRDLPGDPADPAPRPAVDQPVRRQPVRGDAVRRQGLRPRRDRDERGAQADLAGPV